MIFSILFFYFFYLIHVVFFNSGFTRTLCGGAWESLTGNDADGNSINAFTTSSLGSSTARLIGCCPAGSYLTKPMEIPFNDTKLCTKCPIGWFTSVKNAQPNCTTCRVGTVNSELGSLDCKACPAGRTLITISPLNCSICPAGQYQPISGHLNMSITCTSCNVGRFLEDPGLNDIEHAKVDQCLTCPKGYEINGIDITECVVCGYSKVSLFYICYNMTCSSL